MLGTPLSSVNANLSINSTQLSGAASLKQDIGTTDFSESLVATEVDFIDLLTSISQVSGHGVDTKTLETPLPQLAIEAGESGISLAASAGEAMPVTAAASRSSESIEMSYSLPADQLPLAARTVELVHGKLGAKAAAEIEVSNVPQRNIGLSTGPIGDIKSAIGPRIDQVGDLPVTVDSNRNVELTIENAIPISENRGGPISSLSHPLSSARADAPLPSLAQSQPLDSEAGQAELGNKLQWMSNAGTHRAQLTLSPSELGPVEIQLRVGDGEAVVHFVAANANTRDALEHAMPRLRDMLAESGLTLTDGQVFQERPDSQSPSDGKPGDESGERPSVSDDWLGDQESPSEQQWNSFHLRPMRGLIDQFA